MKPVYFTPGPSELYFTINDHIRDALKKGIPSISHRGQAFMDIYRETTKALKELLQLPDNYKILFLSS
ncbi:MAG: phosphoserine aminotransferase, partial [Cyclobacteriaceae bacterium]|nr:phosphoserine aminotransferase [Cyclobacteriaceae bacterium]